MGAYKENEGLIKENFILKFFLIIAIIGLVITFTVAIKFSNEYNDLYKEAITNSLLDLIICEDEEIRGKVKELLSSIYFRVTSMK